MFECLTPVINGKSQSWPTLHTIAYYYYYQYRRRWHRWRIEPGNSRLIRGTFALRKTCRYNVLYTTTIYIYIYIVYNTILDPSKKRVLNAVDRRWLRKSSSFVDIVVFFYVLLLTCLRRLKKSKSRPPYTITVYTPPPPIRTALSIRLWVKKKPYSSIT